MQSFGEILRSQITLASAKKKHATVGDVWTRNNFIYAQLNTKIYSSVRYF